MTSRSDDVISTLCRALYHQLVKETIIDPHAEEESDAGEIVDHVGVILCLPPPYTAVMDSITM